MAIPCHKCSIFFSAMTVLNDTNHYLTYYSSSFLPNATIHFWFGLVTYIFFQSKLLFPKIFTNPTLIRAALDFCRLDLLSRQLILLCMIRPKHSNPIISTHSPAVAAA